MNRLVAYSVAAIAVPFSPPGQDAREALVELRERQYLAGMQAGCNLRSLIALGEEDTEGYEAVARECARLN